MYGSASPYVVYAMADSASTTVILQYSGDSWHKVATFPYGGGPGMLNPVTGDGGDGLWVAGSDSAGIGDELLHYSPARHLTAYPVRLGAIDPQLNTLAQIPGTDQILAGGSEPGPDAQTGYVIQLAG
jgi:hypothetical protein